MPELLDINTALLELEKELQQLHLHNNNLETVKKSSLNIIQKYEENMQSSIYLVNTLVGKIEAEKGVLSKGSEEILSTAQSVTQTINGLLSDLQDQHTDLITTISQAKSELEGFDLKAQQIQIEKQIKTLAESSEKFSSTISQFVKEVERINERQGEKVILENKEALNRESNNLQNAIETSSSELQKLVGADIERIEGAITSKIDDIGNDQARIIQEQIALLLQHIVEQDKKIESIIHSEVVEAKYELGKAIQEVQKFSQESLDVMKQNLSKSENIQEELQRAKMPQKILITIVAVQILLILVFHFI